METKKQYLEQKKEMKKEYKRLKKENKKEYRNKKRVLKEEYKNSLPTINYNDNTVPHRSVLEEIGNATTHGVGSIFSIFALVMMLIYQDSTIKLISALIYFFGLFFMFTMSCLYHSVKYGTIVKKVFRRFDYTSIYLLIGSTFAPILLSYIGGTYGIVFCIIQWVIIITGITLVCVFGPHKLRFIHIPLYFILGWSALLFLPRMIQNDLMFFIIILIGGVVYSLGIIPFAMKKKVAHFIWHFFVLFGAIIQWIGIFLYIYK